ncbi:thioredoxin h [Cyclospora cayetanensis]|uniref:Thioredoxin h n=1 Tax=Cyclospora cayetanensis TaxID=88456 RepID=A0A1D3CQY9_9EIME|nr:thioredoxin h [Cyclospora cayetanensis]
MIICIGPICVPIWHLGILLLMLAKPLIHLFKILTGWEAQDSAAPEKGDSGGGATATDGVKQGGEVRSVRTQFEFDRLLAEAKNAGVPLFVDFGANWCGPCRRIAPIFHHLSQRYSGIFASVNVDDFPDHPDAPSMLPTFKVYRDKGYAIDSLTGASPDKLEALVARHAAKN